MRNPGYKVCIASIAPFIGGAEVAAERLALGLVAEGHEVVLVLGTRGAALERMERSGLRCLHAPMPFTDKWHWWKYIGARNALRRLLRRERPDVLHSNDLPTHQIASDAARGLGIPRVCHHRFPFSGAAIDWFNKFGAERHVFVSRALMAEMSRASVRLSRSHRSVVYDGLLLPPKTDVGDRRRARIELGLPPERVLFTFAGQVIERKGVADLIRAWSLLDAEARERADLVIVGDDLRDRGRYREQMQALAEEVHCPARFIGFQKEIGPWLMASDVVVVPSHVEPLGNATLEAMSYALPVVGCSVGGIPEMVEHERTGLLIPPHSPDRLASAITRLLADEATRLRFGAHGRRRCEELFSLQTHVGAVVWEYRQALDRMRTAGVLV